MTKEEKDLLRRDLCARLPYGVKVQVTQVPIGLSKVETLTYNSMYTFDESDEYITIKPYLRPITSITEEEIYDFAGKLVGGLPHDIYVEERSCLVSCNYGYTDIDMEFCVDDMVSGLYGPEGNDWLLANHFDYRGLIHKGLALSTDKFNPYV